MFFKGIVTPAHENVLLDRDKTPAPAVSGLTVLQALLLGRPVSGKYNVCSSVVQLKVSSFTMAGNEKKLPY